MITEAVSPAVLGGQKSFSRCGAVAPPTFPRSDPVFDGLHPDRVAVTKDFPKAVVANGRDGEILQVLSNLFLNALHALPGKHGDLSHVIAPSGAPPPA